MVVNTHTILHVFSNAHFDGVRQQCLQFSGICLDCDQACFCKRIFFYFNIMDKSILRKPQKKMKESERKNPILLDLVGKEGCNLFLSFSGAPSPWQRP